MTDLPADPTGEGGASAAAAATPSDLEKGPAWDRLVSQRTYYSKSSAFNKRWYMRLKVVQLIAAAAIPVLATVHTATWVTGSLGAIVVVVEGIQQLGQFQANWISYRSTSEALNSEKTLYLASAGPYAGVADPGRLLAERVEAVLSQEHTTWTSGRQAVLKAEQQSGGGAKK